MAALSDLGADARVPNATSRVLSTARAQYSSMPMISWIRAIPAAFRRADSSDGVVSCEAVPYTGACQAWGLCCGGAGAGC